MINFGLKNVTGGFFGTKMLTGYAQHGPSGELLNSGPFTLYGDIDPPEETTGTPTIPPTNIGTVTITGNTSPTEGDVLTYSVSKDGDAGNLSYAWSVAGGAGSSSSATCQVTWGNDGPGQVSCTITSTDDSVQDSPASGTLSVTIQSTITSIGTLNLNGNFNVSEGDVETYSITNTGDAGNLSYLWSVTGGTGSSTTASCNVTWGTEGTGQISCTVTSGDDAPSDSPKTGSATVTIVATATTTDPPSPPPNAPTNISITTSDYIAPVPTSIGVVTVSGDDDVTTGDVETYSVSNNGDAGNLSYAWSIVGGTGSSSTATCQVTWGADGGGQVSCTITSTDELPTDSPASDALAVVINPVPTNIGTLTVSGETSPNSGDVDTYSVSNDGDAGSLSYAWSIVGGTGSSTTDTCEVTWGPDGIGEVSCTITSADPAATDSPVSDALAVTINPVTTTTPSPGGGITPVNDNQARFYVPASATSFLVAASTTAGFYAITDGTNVSSVVNEGSYGSNYSGLYYRGSSASLGGANLVSGDRVITLFPCDANGVRNETAQIKVISLTNQANAVGPTAVDVSYLVGLKALSMMSNATDYDRIIGGGPREGQTPPSITELRAVNVPLGAQDQVVYNKYSYTTTSGAIYTYGYSGYAWGEGADIGGQLLDAAALDLFYSDLANGSGGVVVGGNPGITGDDPTIASTKGYTVYRS
jgi:hypothetical protein